MTTNVTFAGIFLVERFMALLALGTWKKSSSQDLKDLFESVNLVLDDHLVCDVINMGIVGVSNQGRPESFKHEHSAEHSPVLSDEIRDCFDGDPSTDIYEAFLNNFSELLDESVFLSFLGNGIDLLDVITHKVILLTLLVASGALFFKRTDNASQDLHPPLVVSEGIGNRQHTLKHPPGKPAMTIHVVHQFFVVFLKEKISIDLLIVFISFFIVLLNLFQQTQTTVELILANNADQFLHSVIVILHVAY